MSSIDKRVVQMQFDNAQFEQGVKQSMSSLKNLDESLKLKNAGKGFEEAQRAAQEFNSKNGIEKSLESIQSKFSAFGAVAFSAINRITNAAMDCAAQLANMLVIQPITEGFAEYEQGIGSTQTIANATGESMDRINKKLSELNEYSDRTIYRFSDMTSAIGKFSNAGVSLDDSVVAIKGISNEAALAGATTDQASAAMYNFAQALSTGYLGLTDWRSIENAMMATKDFRTELIKTGLELGTLTQDGDKFVSTTTDMNGKISDSFDAMTGFRDSLRSRWITNDVLINTLARYGDETQEVGNKAYLAATQVKTFSQLVDTAAEAMGTGWADSFKIIIGDYEEAKGLWSGVADVLNNMISSYHNARNEQLQTWKDLGGRDKLIQGIGDAWQGVSSRLGAVGEAFQAVFPDNRAQILLAISDAISKFGSALRASDDDLQAIKSGFTDFFETVRKLGSALGTIGGKLLAPLKSLLPVIQAFGNVIGSVFSGIGGVVFNWFKQFVDWISNAANAMPELNFSFEGIANGLNSFAERIRDAFNALKGGGDAADSVKEKFGSVFDSIKSKAKEALDAIKNFFSGAKDSMSGANPVFEAISNAAGTLFSNLKEGFSRIMSNFSFEDFIRLYFAGLSTALTVIYADMNKTFKNLGKSIGDAVKGFFDNIDDGIEKGKEKINPFIDVLNSFKSVLQAYAHDINAAALLKVAAAIGILAVAVTALSSIDSSDMEKAMNAVSNIVLVVTLMMAAFLAIDKLMNKATGVGSTAKGAQGKLKPIEAFFEGFRSIGTAIGDAVRRSSIIMSVLGLTVAVGMLASSVVKIAKSGDQGQIITATVIVGLLSAFATAMYLAIDKFGAGTINLRGVLAMITMAGMIKILVGSMQDIAGMDLNAIIKSVSTLGILMAAIPLALKGISTTKINTSSIIGMIVLTGTLVTLGENMRKLSDLGWDQIARGTAGMAGCMSVLIASLVILTKFGGNGPSLGVMLSLGGITGALTTLGKQMKELSQLGWEELARGLIGLAGALGILLAGITVIGRSKLSVNPSVIISLVVMALSLKSLGNTLQEVAQIGWEGIATGLVGMAGALGILIAGVLVLDNFAGGTDISTVLTLVAMSMVLSQLGSSLSDLCAIGWEGIGVSLVAMGGALALLDVAVIALTKFSGGGLTAIAGAASVLILSFSLKQIADALVPLSQIGWEGVGTSLVAMGGALLEMGIAIAALSAVGPMAILGAASMLIASISLKNTAEALMEIENMGDVGGACLSLLEMLGTLAAGLTAMIAALPGAAALAVCSNSLPTFANGLKSLDDVDPSSGDKLRDLCLGLAAGLTAMIAALPGAAALAVVSASLPQLAVGMKSLQNAGDIGEIGNKIRDLCLALAVGLTAMIAALPGAAALAVAAPALATLAPALMTYQSLDMWSIAAGIGPLLLAIAGGLTAMIAALPGASALVVCAAGLNQLLPVLEQSTSMDMGSIAEGIGKLFGALSLGLMALVPAMAGVAVLISLPPALSALMGVLQVIAQSDISTLSANLIELGNSLSTFSTQVSTLDGAAMLSSADGMTALANAMGVLSGALYGFQSAVDAAASSISSNVDLIINNVRKMESDVSASGAKIASDAVARVSEATANVCGKLNELFSQASQIITTGMDVVYNAISSGIDRIRGLGQKGYSAGKYVMEQIVAGVKSVKSDLSSAGANLVDSAISGVRDRASAAYSAGASIGSNISNGLKNNLKIGSPSKVGIAMGGYFGEGVVLGVKNKMGDAKSIANQLGDTIGESMYDLMDGIDQFTSTPIQPTIRPVIDGTDVSTGMRYLRSDLNGFGFKVGGIEANFTDTQVLNRMDTIIQKMDNLQNGYVININDNVVNDDPAIREHVLSLLTEIARYGGM